MVRRVKETEHIPESDYGPDAYELWLEQRRQRRLRKKMLRKARKLLKSDDILPDTDQLIFEAERDRIGDGFQMMAEDEIAEEDSYLDKHLKDIF